MSGLAHYFEQEGIATVVIALVPQHARKVKPPRALAVPFELGRPLGVPGDKAFQSRVLSAAFATLKQPGPGPIFTQFDEDVPATSSAEEQAWACPVTFVNKSSLQGFEGSVAEEIALLTPWYERGRQARGYTTVGASGLSVEEINGFLNHFLKDQSIEDNPNPDLPLGDTFKLAIEDLKAFYNESAAAQPGTASSKDVADWFWGETSAGKMLLQLKQACSDHSDGLVKLVAAFILVPQAQSYRLKG